MYIFCLQIQTLFYELYLFILYMLLLLLFFYSIVMNFEDLLN